MGIDPLLLAAIAAVPAGSVSYALVRSARSARRNREDCCGDCGGRLYAADAEAGPFLVQGHLVCAACAAKGRRGLIRSLIAAAGITGAAVFGLAAVAIWWPSELGPHPWTPVIATVVSYPALFAGAVALMKRANRRSALRLGVPPQSALRAADDAARAGERTSLGSASRANA